MNVSKNGLALRLFILVAACFLLTRAANAQCQSQTCLIGGGSNCYQCVTGPGQTCQVNGCNNCKTSTCSLGCGLQHSPLLPSGQLASLPGSGGAYDAVSLRQAELASTLRDGITIGLFTPENRTTPLLISADFGNPVLFQQGIILNRGPKTIVAYRIGWVYGYQDRAPVIQESAWRDVYDGPKSNETRMISKEGTPSVSSASGARMVQFFVAEVKFSDGTTWRQDLTRIRELGAIVRSHQSAASKASSTSGTE